MVHSSIVAVAGRLLGRRGLSKSMEKGSSCFEAGKGSSEAAFVGSSRTVVEPVTVQQLEENLFWSRLGWNSDF